MKSLLQTALGADWEQLPASLKAHYQCAPNVDLGHLDVEFPRYLQPCLWLLHQCGALVARQGKTIATRVEKDVAGKRQFWRRTLTYPDGRQLRFNSYWVASADGCLIEFVNRFMGLEMKPRVENGAVHYAGRRFVLKLGRLTIGIPVQRRVSPQNSRTAHLR